MIRILIFLFALNTLFGVQAQKLEPAKWDIQLSKNSVALGEGVEVVFSVSIDADWYVYGSDFDPNLGPLLTTVKLTENTSIEKDGDLISINPSKKHDEIWDGEISYFKKRGKFVQKINISGSVDSIKGILEYQVCTEVDGRCINGRQPFDLKIALTGG